MPIGTGESNHKYKPQLTCGFDAFAGPGGFLGVALSEALACHKENDMAEVTTKPKNLIRLTDAIQRYSLSRSTFDRAANAGVITKHKVGRATFLDTYQIDAYITGERQSI